MLDERRARSGAYGFNMPGAKVNAAYNCDVLLSKQLLPALQFFSSSVTYPAMGMSPLLPECYGTIDNPGNVTKSPELV